MVETLAKGAETVTSSTAFEKQRQASARLHSRYAKNRHPE